MAASLRRRQRQSISQMKAEANIAKNDICHKCCDWTKPIGTIENPGAICADCPHSYHDGCIPFRFRNNSFHNCTDLGFECDTRTAPIYFELPDRKNTCKKHFRGQTQIAKYCHLKYY
eukprot:847047_1